MSVRAIALTILLLTYAATVLVQVLRGGQGILFGLAVHRPRRSVVT